MRKQHSQHDAASKLLFSHRRMAADLVRLLGGRWIDDLALDELERLPSEQVGDGLRQRREDMPWQAPFKKDAGYPQGARAVFHFEFQARVEPHMPERLLEYAALLRRSLQRNGAAESDDAAPACVAVVVYSGRAPWTPPRSVEERTAWTPPALAARQPRFAYQLVDAKDFAGDHAPDGNAARAALALEAASAENLEAAMRRVSELLVEAADPSLDGSFDQWSHGVLAPRFGALPSFASFKEEPTMLAETLLEWEELKIGEGLERGLERGREEERRLLRSLAARRFGGETAAAIRPLLSSLRDAESLAEAGALIVDCKTGAELLEGVRGLCRTG